MKRIIVLGLGNILMGDDGIGVYLVRDLYGKDQMDHVDLQYLVAETDVYFALEAALQADLLIIIDAVSSGKEPGEITVFPVTRETAFEKGISMHNLHFLAEASLMQQPWEGIIIGVEVDLVSYHLGLSSRLQEKYEMIKQSIQEQIRSILVGY